MDQLLRWATGSLPQPMPILSLLLSLLALYAAIVSAYSTARYTLRLAWFSLKWGTILLAALSAYSYAVPSAGGSTGIITSLVGGVGQKGLGEAWRLGSKSVQHWAGSSSSSSSRNRRKKDYSASGLRRTWQAVNRAGRMEEEEQDVARGSIEEALGFVKQSLLAFMQDSTTSDKQSKQSKAKSGGKKLKKKDPAASGFFEDGMTGMLLSVGWARIKRVISDATAGLV